MVPGQQSWEWGTGKPSAPSIREAVAVVWGQPGEVSWSPGGG